jgi:hypothetical protein
MNNTSEKKAETCPVCDNKVLMTMDDGRRLNTSLNSRIICNHCGADLVVDSEDPITFSIRHGVCPACEIVVNMSKSDGTSLPTEVGYVILCDQCGAELEIVKSEPLTFELLQEGK